VQTKIGLYFKVDEQIQREAKRAQFLDELAVIRQLIRSAIAEECDPMDKEAIVKLKMHLGKAMPFYRRIPK